MANKKASPRQLRVGEEIKHIIAKVMQEQKVIDPILQNSFITISQVKMSPDLKLANCYFTVFNGNNSSLVTESLNRHSKFIKTLCAPALRQMKYIPEFRFYYDDSLDNFSKIDKILKSEAVQQDLKKHNNE